MHLGPIHRWGLSVEETEMNCTQLLRQSSSQDFPLTFTVGDEGSVGELGRHLRLPVEKGSNGGSVRETLEETKDCRWPRGNQDKDWGSAARASRHDMSVGTNKKQA